MTFDQKQRLVDSLPVTAIWTEAGLLSATRVQNLQPDDLRDWIQDTNRAVSLVIAERGRPLRWIEWSNRREFWRQEASPLLTTHEALVKNQFPSDHAYAASRWSTECGGPIIVLEMRRRAISSFNGRFFVSQPSEEQSADRDDLFDSDRDFYIDLYRYAVRRYQPIIEKRTGIELGSIQVKSVSNLHDDVVATVERLRAGRLLSFLRRSRIKQEAKSAADKAVGAMHPSIAAVYYGQSVYVNCTERRQCHEDLIAQCIVHELAHRLWERLQKRPVVFDPRRPMRYKKFKMAGEGFATYAERIWFRDAYSMSLRRALVSERLDEASVYTLGLRAVENAVKKMGPEILLRIPNEWERLLDLSAAAEDGPVH
jgi:hypothetical protein